MPETGLRIQEVIDGTSVDEYFPEPLQASFRRHLSCMGAIPPEILAGPFKRKPGGVLKLSSKIPYAYGGNQSLRQIEVE